MVDFCVRHDRAGDLDEFENSPHHGFFVNSDPRDLTYTVMAAGDDILLENGRADRGLGRIFYFSAPRVQYNRTLGNSENDNTAKMLASRDPVQ